MDMKRLMSFAADHRAEIDSVNMANVLMLLSHGPRGYRTEEASMSRADGRVFECKTCYRKFPSFQALGGHRASHKKPRPSDVDSQDRTLSAGASKPKVHECSICGLEFAIGQALGGHMRRHRATANNTEGFGHKSSGKRALLLDLNLPPASDDDETECRKLGLGLELGLGFGDERAAPMVDCFH